MILCYHPATECPVRVRDHIPFLSAAQMMNGGDMGSLIGGLACERVFRV